MSKIHSIRFVQNLPITLREAWNFFSNPANLSLITPSELSFKILTENMPAKMYAGQIIEYTVKPVLGIPVYWMTEITQVNDLEFFVDEQRFGPYRFWHHEHHFREVDGSVEMTDIIYYKLPMGILGSIANKLFVKRQLNDIFLYRKKQVDKLFGKPKQESKTGISNQLADLSR